MDDQEVLMIVGTDFNNPAQVEEFDDWYNNHHVPMLLATPQIIKAWRYHRVDDDSANPEYLAIFKFKNEKDMEAYLNSEARQEALESGKARWPEGKFVTKWKAFYKITGEWGK